MKETPVEFPDPEKTALMRRLSAASLAARHASERYVETRRQCEITVGESRELVRASEELREQLKAVVSSYVSILRRGGAPPERVVALVKDAVNTSHPALEARSRHAIMDEVVKLAIDAYFAA